MSPLLLEVEAVGIGLERFVKEISDSYYTFPPVSLVKVIGFVERNKT